MIHNADDPRARVVDVYVNGALALNNFKYRRATAFLDLSTELEVAVAPQNSRSVDDAIATFNFSLSEGESYVVVADGVLGDWRFEGNPEGIPIGFNLYPFAPARTAADDPALVDLLAFHGSTDAPTVDVVARDVATVVDDISYGSFQGYVSVPPAKYVLDVTTSDGSVTVVSFGADLSGLAGGAATVVASGFLTAPPGPGFALLAVLPDGTVIKLPKLDDDDDF